jgi:hypothetical protein
MRQAWKEYATALGKAMAPAVRDKLVAEILGKAKKVAGASGGFYGVGNKTSQVEQETLAELEDAFYGR